MSKKVEFLIKNGHIIDTTCEIDRIANLAISHGKIVGIDTDCQADNILDATDCYIFPGLIDFHVHSAFGASAIAVKPDYVLANGVTSIVDAGSVGYANFGSFLNVVNNSTVRVKCQLSTFSAGQIDEKLIEDYSTENMFCDRIIDTCEKYSDVIIGLKLRISRDIVGDLGMKPVKDALKILESLPNRHLCIHSSDATGTMSELCDMLRAGDILAHCYHGKGHTIIDKDGKVFDKIKDSKARGVIFDSAHGQFNFSSSTAVKAIADGFYPDIISSDMTVNKMGKSKIVRSLPMIMSKFLALGMPLYDIIRAVTEKPAEMMGMNGKIGTLKTGALADVTIMKKIPFKREYPDIDGGIIYGDEILIPQVTIIDGNVVYMQEDFMN
ncbi:MAG: amidohydrolase family protein [Clostridia bacterium]